MPIGTTVVATYSSGPRLGNYMGPVWVILLPDLDFVWINVVLYCDVPMGTYCTIISRYILVCMRKI